MNESTIAKIKACGFRVYMRAPTDTWCYYTDGTRIGYCQSTEGTYRPTEEFVSSVHVPSKYNGTGFRLSDEITEESLLAAITCVIPSWARRTTVRKWKDWNEFHNADSFNRAYVEV